MGRRAWYAGSRPGDDGGASSYYDMEACSDIGAERRARNGTQSMGVGAVMNEKDWPVFVCRNCGPKDAQLFNPSEAKKARRGSPARCMKCHKTYNREISERNRTAGTPGAHVPFVFSPRSAPVVGRP